MMKTDKDILWPRTKNDYRYKIWGAIINRYLVSFDPLPYDVTMNDALIS